MPILLPKTITLPFGITNTKDQNTIFGITKKLEPLPRAKTLPIALPMTKTPPLALSRTKTPLIALLMTMLINAKGGVKVLGKALCTTP